MQVRYAVAKKLLLGSNYKIWKWESNHHLKLLTHVKLSKFELNFQSNSAFMVIFIYIYIFCKSISNYYYFYQFFALVI